MKTVRLPGYHLNGFAGTHALRHIMHCCAQFHELPQSHCGDNWPSQYIYIYIYIYKVIISRHKKLIYI